MPLCIVALTLFAALMAADADAETEAERLAGTQQKTEPKEITIYIRGGHKTVVSALLKAVDEGVLITGIADFDSLSSIYGLMGVYRKGRSSAGFYGHRFRLTFPPGADVAIIAGAYENLSYIQSVENPVFLGPRMANGIRVLGGGKRAAVRIPTKVVSGTLSGVAFTVIGVGVVASMDDRSSENTHADIGHLLIGMFIGSSVGFPLGVSAVDPYDSLPKTLLVGVIPPVLAGYALAIASEEMEDIGVPVMYIGPIIGSLYASEKWRKSPQARRVSFGLAPTPNGGLSAAAILCF